jgi:hypothetical protein
VVDKISSSNDELLSQVKGQFFSGIYSPYQKGGKNYLWEWVEAKLLCHNLILASGNFY